jgi:hypothetical protein
LPRYPVDRDTGQALMIVLWEREEQARTSRTVAGR